MQNLSVAVVLLNYRSEKNTLDCLDSLRGLSSPHVTVHVVLVQVDNDTPADDLRYLKAYPGLHVLHTKNLGFSGGNNLGVEYALENLHPDYLMLLNNDTRVDKSLVKELLSAAEQHPGKFNMFCPKIYFEDGYEFHKDEYKDAEKGKVIWYAGGIVDKKNVYAWHRGVDEVDHGQFDQVRETGFGTGCCLFFSSETWKGLGGLDTRYFLYVEDLDFSVRAMAKGGKIWFIPSAVVWHKNAGSSGGSGSETQVYYQTRNRLFYGLKNSALRTKVALVKEAMKTLVSGSKAEREGIRDLMLFHMGARRGTTR